MKHVEIQSLKKRGTIASLIAKFLNAGPITNIPYQVTPGNDSEWVLDIQNDWRIIFKGNSENVFTIMYRYGNEHAVGAFMMFIAHRTNGLIIDSEKDVTAPVKETVSVIQTDKDSTIMDLTALGLTPTVLMEEAYELMQMRKSKEFGTLGFDMFKYRNRIIHLNDSVNWHINSGMNSAYGEIISVAAKFLHSGIAPDAPDWDKAFQAVRNEHHVTAM